MKKIIYLGQGRNEHGMVMTILRIVCRLRRATRVEARQFLDTDRARIVVAVAVVVVVVTADGRVGGARGRMGVAVGVAVDEAVRLLQRAHHRRVRIERLRPAVLRHHANAVRF
jgi:hypothetical protein